MKRGPFQSIFHSLKMGKVSGVRIFRYSNGIIERKICETFDEGGFTGFASNKQIGADGHNNAIAHRSSNLLLYKNPSPSCHLKIPILTSWQMIKIKNNKDS